MVFIPSMNQLFHPYPRLPGGYPPGATASTTPTDKTSAEKRSVEPPPGAVRGGKWGLMKGEFELFWLIYGFRRFFGRLFSDRFSLWFASAFWC